ncbi:hypothetical protein SLEP1_g5142 [Rubroshorea leprosula]|uniref:WRKY domain-containing protein n=1 Tax=Rubroshorea leprosula TaxID=152421 RepID=A0AAV5HXD4_9ROSI|nr:hypothetical protein SLEP1_g5142 [Rubroshorea leprosula]
MATTDHKPRINKIKAIKELVEGQECASKLQFLLHNPSQQHASASVGEDLVLKILKSFSQTLSVLSSSDSESFMEASANSPDDSPSDESSESRKRAPPKDRRGCYKRKRNAQTWTVVSPTTEDGHAWRKYGQKAILNSKHPRSYFRCTRKYDQGCGATKQVQRKEDDPQMYQTTYIGVHTCKETGKAPPIVPDSSSWDWEPINPPKQQEPEDPAVMWKDLAMGFGSSDAAIKMGDIDDEVSCKSLEMDSMVRSAGFYSNFHFDESDEFPQGL